MRSIWSPWRVTPGKRQVSAFSSSRFRRPRRMAGVSMDRVSSAHRPPSLASRRGIEAAVVDGPSNKTPTRRDEKSATVANR